MVLRVIRKNIMTNYAEKEIATPFGLAMTIEKPLFSF